MDNTVDKENFNKNDYYDDWFIELPYNALEEIVGVDHHIFNTTEPDVERITRSQKKFFNLTLVQKKNVHDKYQPKFAEYTKTIVLDEYLKR